MNINLGLLWTAVVATLSGSLYLFNNIAWSSDVDRIEVRLIKRDLRDLRHELEHEADPEDRESIERDIEELLDDLCELHPEDRECK